MRVCLHQALLEFISMIYCVLLGMFVLDTCRAVLQAAVKKEALESGIEEALRDKEAAVAENAAQQAKRLQHEAEVRAGRAGKNRAAVTHHRCCLVTLWSTDLWQFVVCR